MLAIPSRNFDAVVIGSGPNGLAAAITMAQAGRSIAVFEAEKTIGGGTRSAELTLHGIVNDVCSAVHPMAASSPFFRTLPLGQFGLEWVHPILPLAHPLDDGTAVILDRSILATAANLGTDSAAYSHLMAPLARDWSKLESDFLRPIGIPRHPLAAARFGLRALRSGAGLAKSLFRGPRARALFAGLAAHSILPLEHGLTAAFGLVLGLLGHIVGWPFARGGSQKIADALAAYLHSLGGEIFSDSPISSLAQLPAARAILCDVTPRQLLAIAGPRLPASFCKSLQRFRYGPGVFKMDWALDKPIPWKAAQCRAAGTVHLGGTLEEIAASERAPWEGAHAEWPFVLLAQPSLFDPTRAPSGKHVAWGYCHVPNGSNFDMSARIENQIERFAPGFRNCILQRSAQTTAQAEAHNANLIGGDIAGGAQNHLQFFLRPTARFYGTPVKGLYLCSSSTPPGGGVHGMCGHLAARRALEEAF